VAVPKAGMITVSFGQWVYFGFRWAIMLGRRIPNMVMKSRADFSDSLTSGWCGSIQRVEARHLNARSHGRSFAYCRDPVTPRKKTTSQAQTAHRKIRLVR